VPGNAGQAGSAGRAGGRGIRDLVQLSPAASRLQRGAASLRPGGCPASRARPLLAQLSNRGSFCPDDGALLHVTHGMHGAEHAGTLPSCGNARAVWCQVVPWRRVRELTRGASGMKRTRGAWHERSGSRGRFHSADPQGVRGTGS
jgi:hypothetical protein